MRPAPYLAMATALLWLGACGQSTPPSPSQVHFGQGPTVICGQTIITSGIGIHSITVATSPTFDVPTGDVSASLGLPVVLRLTSDCLSGATVSNSTPQIIRLGKSVKGTTAGVVAVLVYGLSPGAGTLTVHRSGGVATEVQVPVSG